MSMRKPAAWLASVGCDDYDVDGDGGEDDEGGKDNHV